VAVGAVDSSCNKRRRGERWSIVLRVVMLLRLRAMVLVAADRDLCNGIVVGIAVGIAVGIVVMLADDGGARIVMASLLLVRVAGIRGVVAVSPASSRFIITRLCRLCMPCLLCMPNTAESHTNWSHAMALTAVVLLVLLLLRLGSMMNDDDGQERVGKGIMNGFAQVAGYRLNEQKGSEKGGLFVRPNVIAGTMMG